ncbi:MAG: helix-turn-helix domain-containing protein [Oligoflexia bacterium]|nr:helix-turn-helix domain-containing protein [Oligoflexia bacterium]
MAKGKGRPAVSENIVNLILEMKRCNWGWGALRISQELALMGIKVHKKTIQRILKENGFSPPPTKMMPPTWRSLLQSYKSIWAMDFCSVFDVMGFQVFILAIIDYKTREFIHVMA